MRIFKRPSVLICLSAFLFALSTYLGTIEVSVWIGDAMGFGEYEPMRAYLPLGFLLGLLALLFFVDGIFVGVRKPLSLAQLRKPFSMVSLIVGVTLGVLALTSNLLPWVIAERAAIVIETQAGTFNVAQYHALTGVDLMTGINKVDEISLVFVGAIFSILAPLLCLLESERPDAVRAFLFLLSGMCIIGPLILVYGHRTWWIDLHVNGALGFAVVFKSPGLGLLIATLSAVGLIASGIITTIKLAQQHAPIMP